MIASQPQLKVMNVMTITLRKAPNLRMSSWSFMPCMIDPAPRNMLALKKPWVTRWKIAKT